MKEVLRLSKYYSQDITVREEEVIIVGICGVVGIGKSTIARMIYDTISVNFENKSFIASIKKVWDKDNGQVLLQEQLMSDIAGTKGLKIHDTETGMRQIKMALKSRRSLVVLDEVDHIEQLATLCGSREWFGFGSMILITTRRLPLVIEVLGSLLYGKTIQEWECVLKKLKSIPTNQIQEKMKISCEYLDDSVKDLFSKIAHLYVGEEKLSVTQKLSDFKFPVEIGINTLAERSLIKFDMNNRLHMHELLQEIGKGINHDKPKRKYNYHVFLSFCGYDTREAFASHLWAALKKAGLEVFMDPEIGRGDNISSSLIQAIESSRTSILILSVNYAGSSWCMLELEKIMECHRTVGQQVFPIFFGVQPSHVRNQSGDFGNEFEKLKKSNEQKSNWTIALKEFSNLAGWDKSQYK
ncbi:hypothetical protein K1719_040393 [Acacia pycnantha]|nr:hypothetical protein K1719_040393 [Acacia pycnantha]